MIKLHEMPSGCYWVINKLTFAEQGTVEVMLTRKVEVSETGEQFSIESRQVVINKPIVDSFLDSVSDKTLRQAIVEAVAANVSV